MLVSMCRYVWVSIFCKSIFLGFLMRRMITFFNYFFFAWDHEYFVKNFDIKQKNEILICMKCDLFLLYKNWSFLFLFLFSFVVDMNLIKFCKDFFLEIRKILVTDFYMFFFSTCRKNKILHLTCHLNCYKPMQCRILKKLS